MCIVFDRCFVEQLWLYFAFFSLSLTKERTLVLPHDKESRLDLFLTDSAGMFVLLNKGDQVLVKG